MLLRSYKLLPICQADLAGTILSVNVWIHKNGLFIILATFTNVVKMPVMMEKKEHHGGQAMQIMKQGMLCKQYTHLPEI
jgi:hypothetical protein